MKRAAIFGIGRLFFQHEERIRSEYEVVCLADNDPAKQTMWAGQKILSVPEMCKRDFECVVVVPNVHKMEIVRSLRAAGIPNEKIVLWFAGRGRAWKKKTIMLGEDCCHARFDRICFDCRSSTDFLVLDEIYFQNLYGFHAGTEATITLDIGMNIGLATLFLANQNNVEKVYAFEPFPLTYHRALENIAQNEADIVQKIVPHNFALSDYDGERDFGYEEDFSGDMNILRMDKCTSRETAHVKVRKAGIVISDILAKHPKCQVVIKLDAEGSEYAIMRDMEAAKVLNKVDVFLMETHLGREAEAGEMLARHGFSYFFHEGIGEGTGMLYAVNRHESR